METRLLNVTFLFPEKKAQNCWVHTTLEEKASSGLRTVLFTKFKFKRKKDGDRPVDSGP